MSRLNQVGLAGLDSAGERGDTWGTNDASSPKGPTGERQFRELLAFFHFWTCVLAQRRARMADGNIARCASLDP